MNHPDIYPFRTTISFYLGRKHTCQMATARLLILVIIFQVIMEYTIVPASLFAAEITFSSSAGYNSNPALESCSNTPPNTSGAAEPDKKIKGSIFSNHTISLEHDFLIHDKFSLNIMPSATYQNLWNMPDNHQLAMQVSLSPVNSGNRFTPYVFADSLFYRDKMVEPEERNEFTFGAGGEIILSGRYTLKFEHAWQRLDYLKDAPLFFRAGQGIRMENIKGIMAGNGAEGVQGAIDQLQEIHSARDDIDMYLKTGLDIFLLPSLTASVGFKYEYLNSSLDAESFSQLTHEVSILWNPGSRWQLVTDARIERRTYSDIYDSIQGSPAINTTSDIYSSNSIISVRDVNYTTSVDFRLSFFPDNAGWNGTGRNIELFTELFLEHGEYPLNRESYNQKVLQCGFSLSF